METTLHGKHGHSAHELLERHLFWQEWRDKMADVLEQLQQWAPIIKKVLKTSPCPTLRWRRCVSHPSAQEPRVKVQRSIQALSLAPYYARRWI